MDVKKVIEKTKVDPIFFCQDDGNFEAMFGFSDFGTSKSKDHTVDAAEAVSKDFKQKREVR